MIKNTQAFQNKLNRLVEEGGAIDRVEAKLDRILARLGIAEDAPEEVPAGVADADDSAAPKSRKGK